MMALRDSGRAQLGKHFITALASSVFVYYFPFSHFQCRTISFCSYKYRNPSAGSIVSSNTLHSIRHSTFHRQNAFLLVRTILFYFKKHQGIALFFSYYFVLRNISSQISFCFPVLFSQAFPEDGLSDKMLTLAFSLSSVLGIILFLLFVFAVSFSGFY